jgi:hypothetical protein
LRGSVEIKPSIIKPFVFIHFVCTYAGTALVAVVYFFLLPFMCVLLCTVATIYVLVDFSLIPLSLLLIYMTFHIDIMSSHSIFKKHSGWKSAQWTSAPTILCMYHVYTVTIYILYTEVQYMVHTIVYIVNMDDVSSLVWGDYFVLVAI